MGSSRVVDLEVDWQSNGCERAVECGVPIDRVINARPAAQLLSWTAG